MIYIMGSVHGNAKTYFSMKAKINLQKEDHLYVLGNIFDGNDEHPEQCLIILEDIMKNDNITLIVGEHEYWYLLCNYKSVANQKEQEIINSKMQNMLPKTGPLYNFLSTLSQDRQLSYFDYIGSCQQHKIIRIKNQYYFLSSAYPPTVGFYGDEDIKDKAIDKTIKGGKYLWKIFENPTYYYDADDFKWFVTALKKGFLSFEDKQIKYYDGLENAIVITSCSLSSSIIKTINENNEDKDRDSGYRKYNYATLNTIPYGDYQRIITDDRNNISIDCGCMGNQYDCNLKPTLSCLRIDDDNNITVIYKYNLYE